MSMTIDLSNQDRLLKGIYSALMRREMSLPALLDIVSIRKTKKYFVAYNLCDGSHTQAEISKVTGIDHSNLSKTIFKWEEEGIVIKLKDGKDDLPVHIYPIPKNVVKEAT